MRIPNITQSIDHLARCKMYLEKMTKINPNNYYQFKNGLLNDFQSYISIRLTYNKEITEIQNKLTILEKDFIRIVNVKILSLEEIEQLKQIINELQNLIFNEIKNNPKHLEELKEKYPHHPLFDN